MRMLVRALVTGPLRREPLRTAVSVIAVALGVAVALAIDLANATAVSSFASSVNVVSRSINLQVLGTGASFDERTLLRVQDVDGVRYASPAIESALTIGARRGDPFSGEILRILGVDILRPLPDGAVQGPAPDPAVLVLDDGVVVSARVAAHYGLHVGSTLSGLAGDRTVLLRVAGIMPGEVPGLDSSVAFVDLVTAQERFGTIGRIDRIDLIVDPARLAAVRAAIARVLPRGTRVVAPQTRTDEVRRMLRSFQLNLAALSWIALLVGAFLIYDMVAISVVRRRFEIGTLRALGATRGEIFRAFLAEGAVVGVGGSLLGLALGSALATVAVGAVSRTVDTLYVASHADHVVFAPLALLRAFAVGTVVSLGAALAPAIDAARTAPAITMRAQGYERRVPRLAGRCALAGSALLAVAYGLSRLPPVDDIPVAGYASGLFLIFGATLFAPAGIAAVARLGSLLARRNVPGRLAVAELGASPIRTGVAVAALVVAIGMTVSVAVLISSFRATVTAWAGETLKADLFVRPLGLADASFGERFSPRVVAAVRRVPGVAAVDTFRGSDLPFRGGITTLAATDLSLLATHGQLQLLGTADPAKLAASLPGSDGVLVSEPFANRWGVTTGERVTFPTPSGPHAFTVAGVYNDYSSDAGVAIVDERTYARLFHDDGANSIAVYAVPGSDLTALRTRIIRSVEPARIDVTTNAELRRVVIDVFDRTFSITYALFVVAIAIAVMAVMTTLFALVVERRREIGLLRYLGLRTREVRSMILAEALALGVLGGVGGLALGMPLALLLIFVINRQSFGWLIDLHIPGDLLAETFALVVAASLLAGLWPARLAARIRTADAVREE